MVVGEKLMFTQYNFSLGDSETFITRLVLVSWFKPQSPNTTSFLAKR